MKKKRVFRNWWVNVHLWLGLSLGVLGIFIGITGSILVYDNELDAMLNPQRYAVSGPAASLSATEYFEHASKALDGRARPVNLRIPEQQGLPVIVFARGRGERGGFERLYLDPPTGRVLDTSSTGGIIGWVHSFHENLTLREYMGREIVGLVGFAMLISSLSGIYLWWPARGRWRQALGMRPEFTLSRNLHYMLGFYTSLVLAMLSFTGIYLAYPDAGRAFVGALTPVSATVRNLQAPESAAPEKSISLDEAIVIARRQSPNATVTSAGLPNGPRDAYRVSLGGSAAGTTVFIDRAGNELRRVGPDTQTGGDRFLAAQRPLHNGETFGTAGKLIVCIVGLLPALLVVTGTLMWLRKRRAGTPSQQGPASPATSGAS